jgi:hypothetical protein
MAIGRFEMQGGVFQGASLEEVLETHPTLHPGQCLDQLPLTRLEPAQQPSVLDFLQPANVQPIGLALRRERKDVRNR